MDYSVDAMKYSDFVDKELILFSIADNLRSIPSMVTSCCFEAQPTCQLILGVLS